MVLDRARPILCVAKRIRHPVVCAYGPREFPACNGTIKLMKHFPYPNRKIKRIIRIRVAHANATIMPASLLPSKVKYSQVANQLPSCSILILTPPRLLSKQRSTPAKVAAFLRSNLHHATTLPSSLLSASDHYFSLCSVIYFSTTSNTHSLASQRISFHQRTPF